MGRILCIDYGTKRCGIAVSDELQIIATGLTTVRTHDLETFLKDYFAKEKVDVVVLGEPKQMDNTASESEQYIQAFVKRFRKLFPDRKLDRCDERFTSVLAQRSIIDSGIKKKARQNKALIDEVSAVIILQSYMEFR